MEIRIKDFDISILNKILEKTLKAYELQEVYYLSKIFRHWDIVIGDPLSLKTAPKNLKKRTLTIIVEDATYAHHLRFYAERIMSHIASLAICGENAVKRIKFHVGEVKANRFVVFKEIRTNWEIIINSPLAGNCSPAQLLDDRLVVFVPEFYHDHLIRIEKDILKRINQVCSKNDVVKKIRVQKIPNSDAFRDGVIEREAYTRALARNAQQLGNFESKHHETLEKISDLDVRKRFAKMMKSAMDVKHDN